MEKKVNENTTVLFNKIKSNKGGRIKADKRFVERRGAKDGWARLFILINYVAWAGLMAFLLTFHWAQPEFETFFDRFYQLDLRTYWNKAVVRYLFYIAVSGCTATTAGLCLSLFRARRTTDRKKSIIVLAGLYFFLLILSWQLL